MQPKKHKDRRWSPRRVLASDVELRADTPSSMRGVARNVSIGGMFVETHEPWRILRGPLYVTFAVNVDGHVSNRCVRAKAIWTSGDGAGLMFSDYDQDTIPALRALMDDTLSVQSV